MVQDAAGQGYQRHAGTYDEARPTYHPEVAKRVAAQCGGLVAEIGAGTGIFTAQPATHGVDVLAIEPVEAMRRTMRERRSDLRVLGGTAEAVPRWPSGWPSTSDTGGLQETS